MKRREIDSGLIERIRLIMSGFNFNQAQLASRVGIQPSNLSTILSGKRSCDDAVINKFVLSLNISKSWLLTGDGEMLSNEKELITANPETPYIPEQLVRVRTMEISPSATFEEFTETNERETNYTYILPAEGEEIDSDDVVFKIQGRSMEPTIPNGASVLGVLIRKSHWHWAKGVVIIAYGNSFVIKRIIENRLEQDNYLVIGSDNPNHEFLKREKVSLSEIRVMYQAERIVSSIIK